MLIDGLRLRSHLTDPTWVVFDCRHDLLKPGRGAQLYAEGHIPGAHFAPVDTALSGPMNGTNGRHPLPAPEAFASFLAHHGVTADTQIVAYDDVGGQYAARLWWLARWIGLSRVGVLDGGLPKWIAEGPAVDQVTPPRSPVAPLVPTPDASRIATTAEVLAGLGHSDHLVLDARAPERFRGEVEPLDPVAGHIPHAQNRFFKTNLQPDQTFRPPVELRREFEALLQGRPPGSVIHQCGSGVTACVNLLAMEIAGLSGSRLYAGSWSEWVSDRTRPVARG